MALDWREAFRDSWKILHRVDDEVGLFYDAVMGREPRPREAQDLLEYARELREVADVLETTVKKHL